MDETETRVRDELAGVIGVLEDLLGRRSRWNGILQLSPERSIRGKMQWDGMVLLRADLAQEDVRWRTLIRKSLHTFSVGSTPVAYADMEGWGEGVVEQLQRLLRPRVLQSLEVTVSETVFRAVEEDHPYNKYVAAFERLRVSLGKPEEAFYTHLLSVPHGQRANDVIAQGQSLPREDFLSFRRVFSVSFSQLRG